MEYTEYQQIHAHNELSSRFPIGKVSQIQNFTAEDLRRFYKKWYRPDNMTLYVVGKDFFILVAVKCNWFISGDIDGDLAESCINDIFGSETNDTPKPQPKVPLLGSPAEELTIFQHELLHQFCITFNHLMPVYPQSTVGDIRAEMMFDLIGMNEIYYMR